MIMELFSEIYSCYYSVTSKILHNSPLSDRQIKELISSNAYNESAIYLMPKLCEENGWGLLTKENGSYSSRLSHPPRLPITLLEKRWLKSLLQDPRIHLFMEADSIKDLTERLSEIKPLYQSEHFKWFDIFTDGDDYANKDYVHNFKIIMDAIKSRSIVTIIFRSGKGKLNTGDYLPYRLEYSQKNDRFRVIVAKLSNMKPTVHGTVNLSRIYHIKNTGVSSSTPIELNQLFERKRCIEPVVLTIKKERNGIERFMMEFASYEKHTILDDESGECTATLWYDLQDETELLIKLLSFGPILKVIAPQRMLDQMRERVNRQFQLLHPDSAN